MAATGMAFAVLVVIAVNVGVEGKSAGEKRLHRFVGTARNAAVELDSCLRECVLRAASDAAADELFGTQTVQEASQCAVTAAQYRNHFGADHLSIFHFRHEELPAVSEMSEYLSIFIRYRNFHCI